MNQWLGPLLGFASGVGISVVAAVVSSLLQKREERRRRRDQAAFEIYMLLLELDGQYFWIASGDLHGKQPDPEIAARVRGLAWRIADKLREADDVPHLEELLTVLMSIDAYKTAADRAQALTAAAEKLGETVNPRYKRVIRRVSETNLAAMAAGHSINAPGLLR